MAGETGGEKGTHLTTEEKEASAESENRTYWDLYHEKSTDIQRWIPQLSQGEDKHQDLDFEPENQSILAS